MIVITYFVYISKFKIFLKKYMNFKFCYFLGQYVFSILAGIVYTIAWKHPPLLGLKISTNVDMRGTRDVHKQSVPLGKPNLPTKLSSFEKLWNTLMP